MWFADDNKVCLSYYGPYDEQKVEEKIVDDVTLSVQGEELEFVMLNGSEVLSNDIGHGGKCDNMCEHSSNGKDAGLLLDSIVDSGDRLVVAACRG